MSETQSQDRAVPIVAPVHMTPLTPAEVAEGHSTITMQFPNPVHLTIATNTSVYYPAGVHEVPDHLADHWYLKAHGAQRYYRPVNVPAAVATQPQTAQPQQPRQNGGAGRGGRNSK